MALDDMGTVIICESRSRCLYPVHFFERVERVNGGERCTRRGSTRPFDLAVVHGLQTSEEDGSGVVVQTPKEDVSGVVGYRGRSIKVHTVCTHVHIVTAAIVGPSVYSLPSS